MNDRALERPLSATFARNDQPMVSDIFNYRPPETRSQKRERVLLACAIAALVVVPWVVGVVVGVVRIALWLTSLS